MIDPLPTPSVPPSAPADPNWFFSTLAQSTAALISLLGAILITRLIDYKNSEIFNRSRDGVSDAIATWRHNVWAETVNARQRVAEEPHKVLSDIIVLLDQDSYFARPSPFQALLSELTRLIGSLIGVGQDDVQALVRRVSHEGPVLCDRWRAHDRLRVPLSLYAMFGVLVFLGIVGLLLPLGYLSGFHARLFWCFVIGYALLCLAIVWLLYDLARRGRVRYMPDPNLFPWPQRSQRAAAEGGHESTSILECLWPIAECRDV